MESGGGEGRRRRTGRGREDQGGPGLGSPIASELANAITVSPLRPLPQNPLPFLGNQPTDWSPTLNWSQRAAGCGRHRRRGAGLKSPVPGTKVTLKGKDSE